MTTFLYLISKVKGMRTFLPSILHLLCDLKKRIINQDLKKKNL